MHEYLVERYEPGIAVESVRADARRLRDAVSAMKREGASIEFLESTFLPGDEGVFSRFSSDSEELIAAAHERASIPFERIVESMPLDIEQGGPE